MTRVKVLQADSLDERMREPRQLVVRLHCVDARTGLYVPRAREDLAGELDALRVAATRRFGAKPQVRKLPSRRAVA